MLMILLKTAVIGLRSCFLIRAMPCINADVVVVDRCTSVRLSRAILRLLFGKELTYVLSKFFQRLIAPTS